MNLRILGCALLVLLASAPARAQDDDPEPVPPAASEPGADSPQPAGAGELDSPDPASGDEPALRETVRRLEERLAALESRPGAPSEGPQGPGVIQRAWDALKVHMVGVGSYGVNVVDPDQRKGANRFRVSDLDHDSFTPNFFKLGIQKPLSGKNEFDAGLRLEVAAGSTVEDTLSLDPQFLGGDEINLANAYLEVQLATIFDRPLVVRLGRA